jgi:hypothetical protein
MSPSSLSYFDSVASVGSKILEAIGGSATGSTYRQYLALVEELYTLFSTIHDNLIDVTIEVHLAGTDAQALEALSRVQRMGLRDMMKTQEMCDDLMRVGQELRAMPFENYGFTEEETKDLKELLYNLERAESGTSHLYDRHLYDLRVLAETGTSLELVKGEVGIISNILSVQKAKFDHLAKLARAMRKI